MSWGYDNVLPNEGAGATVTTETPVAASAPAQPASTFSPEEQTLIMGAPPEIKAQVVEMMKSGLTGEQLHTGVMSLVAPVGNDAMVASPTTQGINDQRGMLSQQANEGRATYTEEDIKNLASRVENRVKELMLAGASK